MIFFRLINTDPMEMETENMQIKIFIILSFI
nr:MAG TPA: hypothetical protein [Caudoviricetes sp.]